MVLGDQRRLQGSSIRSMWQREVQDRSVRTEPPHVQELTTSPTRVLLGGDALQRVPGRTAQPEFV